MRVTCLGATRTVTGSCFLVENEGTRLLVDCGMFQGGKEIEKRNASLWRYKPPDIQTILLTHAHIDHSGLIPRAVKEGFKGKILCTQATFELCQIMLRDSAHIQEIEAEWRSRKKIRSGKKGIEPLYTMADAERSLSLFQTVKPGDCLSISPDIRICFHNAGHILGSAFLEIRFQEKGLTGKVIFSGDLGRQEALIVPDPEIIEEADFLFLESTYGDRQHKSIEDSKQELLAAILEGVKYHEKIIIPAFAVERTQEILFVLHEFRKQGLMPSIPIFVDSPLAISATEIFRKYPEYFDQDTTRLLDKGEKPLDLPEMIYTRTTEESMAINRQEGSAIIIAASGMCDAGRIKHHLKHNLWRAGVQIVITGFQAQGTLGRSIVDGAKKVRIFNEEVVVRAKVHTIGGFSAHADQQELLSWIGHFKNPKMRIYIIHGEEATSLSFAEAIRKAYPFKVEVPNWMETLTLTLPEGRPAEWTSEAEEILTLSATLEERLHSLKGNIKDITGIEKAKIEEIRAFLKKTDKNLEGLMQQH
jgi:metallo-beta-lactamase family protein